MRSAVKKRESLHEDGVSQSKQVSCIFIANMDDDRALVDSQHGYARKLKELKEIQSLSKSHS